jgi:hypothetical protein
MYHLYFVQRTPNCVKIRLTKCLHCTYIFFHSIQDERLQFVEAVIDTRATTLFHNRFVTLKQERRQFSASSEAPTDRLCQDQVTSELHCTVQTAACSLISALFGCWADGPTLLKKTTVTMFIHLLTPWSRVLLEKLTSLQLVKKFTAFLWNPKVLYHHLSLS